MTLVEKLNKQYDQAIAELRSTIDAPPCTPQQRYDLKKAQRAGRTGKRSTAQIERLIHELETERRYILKGVGEVVALIENYAITNYIVILEAIGYESKEN